jgi:hypothetical protein
MNNGRDCEHGRQFGKCDTCDLIEAEKRIDELEQKNAELKAHINYIKSTLVAVGNWPDTVEDKKAIANAISATPAQCLAEIKAQAFKQGLEACVEAAIDLGLVDNCAETCNQLRQQAKEL